MHVEQNENSVLLRQIRISQLTKKSFKPCLEADIFFELGFFAHFMNRLFYFFIILLVCFIALGTTLAEKITNLICNLVNITSSTV